MDSQYINGGTIGPNASFGDGNVFENVTIIAPSTFGVGNTFINVTWQCLRLPRTNCRRRPCGCCPDVSTVGVGGTFVNNTGSHLTTTSPSVFSGFSDNGCGLLTSPDCVDCANRGQIGGQVTSTNDDVVVSDRGTLSYEDWCKKCGINDVVAGDAGQASIAKSG
jgi:hypothetical protein